MPQSLINIAGEVRDASSLTLPASREFRGAWQFNGAVVEVDMVKARELKIEKVARKAIERAEQAEQRSMRTALRNASSAEDDREVARFRSRPTRAGVDRIANAATPEELDAITEDEVFE